MKLPVKAHGFKEILETFWRAELKSDSVGCNTTKLLAAALAYSSWLK